MVNVVDIAGGKHQHDGDHVRMLMLAAKWSPASHKLFLLFGAGQEVGR